MKTRFSLRANFREAARYPEVEKHVKTLKNNTKPK